MDQAAAIPLARLNMMSTAEFAATLGEVFERAPWLAEAAAGQRPFATVTALHECMLAQLAAAPVSVLADFLNNHPDLAAPAMRTAPLGADSAREQAGAGLDRLTEAETARLAALNQQYRARFGFPFIICALRHSQESIFAEFERRLAADLDAERCAALAEVGRISALRLVARVIGPGMPNAHGHLSTHLLDTARGQPAAGVPIELYLVSKDGSSTLEAAAISNADGRTPAPLIAGRPIPNGTYELRFELRAYLVECAVSDFLDVVLIRFTTSEPEGHYHIPLLFTPWSYTTYRGS